MIIIYPQRSSSSGIFNAPYKLLKARADDLLIYLEQKLHTSNIIKILYQEGDTIKSGCLVKEGCEYNLYLDPDPEIKENIELMPDFIKILFEQTDSMPNGNKIVKMP